MLALVAALLLCMLVFCVLSVRAWGAVRAYVAPDFDEHLRIETHNHALTKQDLHDVKGMASSLLRMVHHARERATFAEMQVSRLKETLEEFRGEATAVEDELTEALEQVERDYQAVCKSKGVSTKAAAGSGGGEDEEKHWKEEVHALQEQIVMLKAEIANAVAASAKGETEPCSLCGKSFAVSKLKKHTKKCRDKAVAAAQALAQARLDAWRVEVGDARAQELQKAAAEAGLDGGDVIRDSAGDGMGPLALNTLLAWARGELTDSAVTRQFKKNPRLAKDKSKLNIDTADVSS